MDNAIFFAELVGTMVLIIFGGGVVATNSLFKSKGFDMGWVGITLGWGLGVTMGALVVHGLSGAHLNPAVTIAFACIGSIPWSEVPSYVLGQFAGAFLGAVIVYLVYSNHWKGTEDADAKLGVFSTGPAIRNYWANFVTETIGTFILVLGLLGIGANDGLSTGMGPFLSGLLIVVIGLSLGGPTGYAINPARDLGPRIAHAILPIPGKRDSDWGYSWVPVFGPLVGGVLAAYFYKQVFVDFSIIGLLIFVVVLLALVFAAKSDDKAQ